jgi:4'-phosphopantetheinyl transferase
MPDTDATARSSAELWLIDLDRVAPTLLRLDEEIPRLGAAERAAILAFGDADERRRRLAAHVALRLLIEGAIGKRGRGKDFVREGAGKPRLAGADIDFSLAHSAELALIGVARASPIGVDLETIRPVVLAHGRRQKILEAAAALGEHTLAAAAAEAAFVQAWVRLEAVAKASGLGLARTLAQLGLWHGEAEREGRDVAAAARSHLSALGLKVCDLAPAAGRIGAVALATALPVPAIRSFPLDRGGIAALAEIS